MIQDKFDLQRLAPERLNGICVLGLYGMHGIGKTSICKALWNEFFIEFCGRVCHVEFPSKLEKRSEEELLREVVKRLIDTRHELLEGLTIDQLRNKLQRGKLKEAVFMALDNLLDASIQQAMELLDCLPSGSIVLVTGHSKDMLIHVRPYVDETHCLEMPKLEVKEARSLFAKSSNFESKNEVGEQLILRCIEQCYFQKNDGNSGGHYHPLALDVLGKQLRCIDPKDWEVQLDKINEDILNRHPIFSIFRKTFCTLSREDQILFMDVACFLPDYSGCDIFEWLGMVHRSATDVRRGLERLKTKSMLERIGETRIGMHDLWRAFCDAEIKSGELGSRPWVYEAGNHSELVETTPSGACWENVKRMAFFNCQVERLERVKFAHFSNVTVLKMWGLRRSEKCVLDLSGLIHLKSLEVLDIYPRLVVHGLPKDLIFLSFHEVYFMSFSSRQSRKHIGCLEKVQHLRLDRYRGGKLPDMGSMVSVQKAIFKCCYNVVTLTGLSPKLTNLRVLELRFCPRLRSCPGVGDLIALEELNFHECRRLERLPNLRKLRKLRKLDISYCELITALPGLGELVALEELHARSLSCSTLKVPDIGNLRNLQVLDFGNRRLKAVAGFDRLVSLQRVVANFRDVVDKPNLWQLTQLRSVDITGWSFAGLRGLDNLAMLNSLGIRGCSGVDELPDLRSLIRLQTFRIENCEFKGMSGLRDLSAVKTLTIEGCVKLERLPDFQRLTRLKLLVIKRCPMLIDWDCESGHAEGSLRWSNDSCVPSDCPRSSRLSGLRRLELRQRGFVDVRSIGAFFGLETLLCSSLPELRELPDLSNFPRLMNLRLQDCMSLRGLTSREPISVLSKLTLGNCSSVATLPDLRNFPGLQKLSLRGCDGITTLSSTEPLHALEVLDLQFCCGLEALPDLGMFPAILELRLDKCIGLLELSSTEPLPALRELCLSYCRDLKALPDLGMFPAILNLQLNGCSGLMTLSSSVPLHALRELNAKGCRSLRLDDLDRLRALCPKYVIFGYPLVLDVEEPRRSRVLGCFRG